MAFDQREYYLSRAAEERAAAASAPKAILAELHRDLAAMYDRMAKEAAREREPELAD